MTGEQFEKMVRETARAMWHLPSEGGAAEIIDGQEIDCVCRTDELVHLIECTTERKQDKVIKQVNKLVAAKRAEERRGNTVKMWIVTSEEPTADQTTVARREGVTLLSFGRFQDRLLDAHTYLEARRHYVFGSARDPESESSELAEDEYVPVPMHDRKSQRSHTIRSLADLLAGDLKPCIVLLGSYGAGKSLSVREVFKTLRTDFYETRCRKIPVAINLRDHWGQSEVDEILHRHASKVGYPDTHKLVRAWNAGRLIVLLDGFDEVAVQGWRLGQKGKLRDSIRASRYQSMTGARNFVRQANGRSGILIAGRDHYFDNDQEMFEALGLPRTAIKLELADFTDEQAQQYLRHKKIDTPLPTWLPRKPLLLGYLACKGLLKRALEIGAEESIASSWNSFLDLICEREARLPDDIDGNSVRRILETLATIARTSPSGLGPLDQTDLNEAYRRVTGLEALEGGRTLLQRLPGLTARDQEEGLRSFIDDEMVQALRAGDVIRFLMNPYEEPLRHGMWRHSLGEIGTAVAAEAADYSQTSRNKHVVAACVAQRRWREPVLALDCLGCGAIRGEEPLQVDVEVTEAIYDVLDLEQYASVRNLVLRDSLIDVVRIGGPDGGNVRFVDCEIARVEGASSHDAMPSCFENCTVGEFDANVTNASIMASVLPDGMKVLLTI